MQWGGLKQDVMSNIRYFMDVKIYAHGRGRRSGGFCPGEGGINAGRRLLKAVVLSR